MNKALIIIIAAVLIIVNVPCSATQFITPTGATFHIDYEAASEAALTGLLIADVSSTKVFHGRGGYFRRLREFVVFDFDAERCFVLDERSLGLKRKPVAIPKDRNKVLFLEGENYTPGNIPTTGCLLGEYVFATGDVSYFNEERIDITGYAYSSPDESIFYSYVNRDRTPRRDEGVRIYKNNIKRIDITSREFKTVTAPDYDCRLLSLAPDAQFMLVAERRGAVPWTDDIAVYDYEGRRLAVLTREALRPVEGYKPILSPDGGLGFAGGEVIYFGLNPPRVVSGRNVYAIYKDGGVTNLTYDRVNWLDYCLSPEGNFLGLVVDGFTGGGVSSRPGFYVLNINTLEITSIITKPFDRWFIPVSWNK
jgi:hypothetical protein